ncbi:hypothetical protein HDU86_008504 [Geranomyces michiganensis]|nr:hypothetical protein HDU86_008504 [Geranomyces michiganensis]
MVSLAKLLRQKKRLQHKQTIHAVLRRRLRLKVPVKFPAQLGEPALPPARTKYDKQEMKPTAIDFVESETVLPLWSASKLTSVWSKPHVQPAQQVSPQNSSESHSNKQITPAVDSVNAATDQDNSTRGASPIYTSSERSPSPCCSTKSSTSFQTISMNSDNDSDIYISDLGAMHESQDEDDGNQADVCGFDSSYDDQDDAELPDEHFDTGISDSELAVVLDSHELLSQEAKHVERAIVAESEQKPTSDQIEAKYTQLLEERIESVRREIDQRLTAFKIEAQTRSAEDLFRAQSDALRLLVKWARGISALGKPGRAELKAFLRHAVDRMCSLVEIPDSLLFGLEDLNAKALESLGFLAEYAVKECSLFHDVMQPSALNEEKFPDFCKRQHTLVKLSKYVIIVLRAHEKVDGEVRATAGFLTGQITLKLLEGQERSARSLIAKMERAIAEPMTHPDSKKRLQTQVFRLNRKFAAKFDMIGEWKATAHLSLESLKGIWEAWRHENESDEPDTSSDSEIVPDDIASEVEMADEPTAALGKRKYAETETGNDASASTISTDAESEPVTPPESPAAKKQKVEPSATSSVAARGKRNYEETETGNDVSPSTISMDAENEPITPPESPATKKQKVEPSATSSVARRLGAVVGRSVAVLTCGFAGWLAATEQC